MIPIILIDLTNIQGHPRSNVNLGSDFQNVLIGLKFDRNDPDNTLSLNRLNFRDAGFQGIS